MTQTKEICDRCGDVYLGGPHSFYCQACRKRILSESAKKRNLNQIGIEAKRNRKEEK